MSSPQRSRTSSPASPSAEAAGPTAVDPLVAETARKIAHVINDLKRDLDTRDGTGAEATGAVKLVVDGTTFELSIVPSEDGVEHPITVQTTRKKSGDTIEQQPNSSYKTTRRASDAELAGDIVSRNKRKLEDNQDGPSKRSRTEDDEDIMPLITKEDLSDLLTTLREDIQEDTSECVNHVQRLLRRSREEWQESSQWKTERSQSKQIERSLQDTVPANGSTPGVSFPSPSADREDPDSSTTDVLRREAKLISTQIKWVEDCRRVAADIQGKKEEIWRTSSAGFHDRQRQDREAFQHRMLHESGLHTHTLNQILNEVKAIGLYAQSMKWETPTSHLIYPSPSIPTPPAFPTQPAPPTPAPKPAVRARPAQQPPPPPPAPPQHPNQV